MPSRETTCSRDKLLAASRDYHIITDNHPSLEFTAPISHWNEDTTGPVNMRRKFLTLLEPVEPLFTGTVNWDLAKRFQESRRLLHEGFIREEGDKDISGAYERYLAAYHLNPDDIKASKAVFITHRKTTVGIFSPRAPGKNSFPGPVRVEADRLRYYHVRIVRRRTGVCDAPPFLSGVTDHHKPLPRLWQS